MTYTYDNAGRNASEGLTTADRTCTTAMKYNERGEVSKYTYRDGTEIERTYTERGQLHQVKFNGNTQDTRTYDDGGRMLTSAYANGVVTSRSYNDDNTLSLIDFGGTSGGNNIGDLTYTWDSNKNKTSESIAGAMSGYSFTVPTSGYDKEDRLVGFDGAANQPDQSWNLSLIGDWDSVTTDGTTQNRTHDPTHELLTADGKNVVQDAKGNMTTIPANLRKSNTALNLTWDFDNRMSGADIDGDGTTDVTYQFDALGRRVGRTQGNNKRVYPQVGQQTVADYQPGAAASRPASRYLWGSYIDEPIVRLNPNGASVYYHQNQQYSTYALTNASGQIVERYAYTAYGEQKVLAPSTKSTYGIRHTYTGREWDSALGLYHFRARMYDPRSGRFCSKDPMGYADGMGLYRAYFVAGGMDPSGTHTLADAESSLEDRGVAKEGVTVLVDIPGGNLGQGMGGQHIPGLDIPDIVIHGSDFYTETQIFNEWLRLEKADQGWLNNIPACPDKIKLCDGEPASCDNGDWHGLGEASQTFHPGAKWCMRSKEFSDSAQQCCYDEKGDLLTTLPAAGTPDRYGAGFWNGIYLWHYNHDVATYNLAVKLGRLADYGLARPPSKGGGSCYAVGKPAPPVDIVEELGYDPRHQPWGWGPKY